MTRRSGLLARRWSATLEPTTPPPQTTTSWLVVDSVRRPDKGRLATDNSRRAPHFQIRTRCSVRFFGQGRFRSSGSSRGFDENTSAAIETTTRVPVTLRSPGEFNQNRARRQKKTRTRLAVRSPSKRRGTLPGGPPRRPSDGSRQSPITVDQRRCPSAVTLGAAVFARSARVAHDKGAAATGTRHVRAQPPDRDRKGSPIKSCRRAATPPRPRSAGAGARRRASSRSRSPRSLKRPRSSLRRRPPGAGRSNKRCGAGVDRRGVEERRALREGRPGARRRVAPPGHVGVAPLARGAGPADLRRAFARTATAINRQPHEQADWD